ncbi:MAG: hypothetical protein WC665_10365 [Sulfurimonas sp.]|jgi:hypothetical protein
MKEIKLFVKDENLKTVLSALNNLETGLISKIETASEDAPHVHDVSNKTRVINNNLSTFPSRHVGETRKKLFSFAFGTLIILSIAAVYFEAYDKTYVPPFLRVVLAAYWFYSLTGIIIAKRGSDYWVSKLYFNVSK